MSDSNIRLTRRQIIERYTDNLVDHAGKIIKELEPNARRKLELSQLNNFLGVTRETNSVSEMDNWMRYQMGRNDTREAWKESGLGKGVTTQIGEMRKWAAQVNPNNDPKLQRDVALTHAQFVRLLAGYLVRWYVAEYGQKGGRE